MSEEKKSVGGRADTLDANPTIFWAGSGLESRFTPSLPPIAACPLPPRLRGGEGGREVLGEGTGEVLEDEEEEKGDARERAAKILLFLFLPGGEGLAKAARKSEQVIRGNAQTRGQGVGDERYTELCEARDHPGRSSVSFHLLLENQSHHLFLGMARNDSEGTDDWRSDEG